MVLFRQYGFRSIALFATQGIALVSLIFALPNCWSGTTRTQGLAISCTLFLLYLTQATLSTWGSTKARQSKIHVFCNLFEWPILMSALYFGWRWIPISWLEFYEHWILYPSAPLLTLLEGVCYLLIVLAITYTDPSSVSIDNDFMSLSSHSLLDIQDEDDSWDNGYMSSLRSTCIRLYRLLGFLVRGGFGLLILIISMVSLWQFIIDPYQYYFSSIISVPTASLLASILTLYIGSIIFSQSRGVTPLLQPALLLPYIVYNLWMIRRSVSLTFSSVDTNDDSLPLYTSSGADWLDWIFSQDQEKSYIASEHGFQVVTNNHGSRYFSPSFLFSTFQSNIERFTIEIIIHLLFRLGIYILSSRIVHRWSEQMRLKDDSDDSDSDSHEQSIVNFSFYELNLLTLTNLFGKCCLVLIYTLSWLEGTESSNDHYSLSLWRWINLYIFIFLYIYYLSCQPSHDNKDD
jgi:hypothetical protein